MPAFEPGAHSHDDAEVHDKQQEKEHTTDPPPIVTVDDYTYDEDEDELLISLCLLEDPVFTSDGQTYSRQCIQDHMDHCARKGKPLTSPMTNLPIEPTLTENVMARRLVSNYVQEKRKELEEMRRAGKA